MTVVCIVAGLQVMSAMAKSCDDAIRCQLEAKQKAHDSHVTKIVAEKDQEVMQAHQGVSGKSQLAKVM